MTAPPSPLPPDELNVPDLVAGIETVDLGARHAWRGAVVAALLNAVGLPADLLITRPVPGLPSWPSLGSGALGIVLVVVLLARRRRPSVRFGAICFLINIAVMLVALWITSGYYATAARPWIPFQANKLGSLAAAVLAPELFVGFVSIAGFVAMVVARYLTFDPAIRQQFPIGEPWTIFIYALFATVLLIYRQRWLVMERDFMRAQAEAVVSQRLARTFLAVRDYASTPVQTIAIGANIIRARNPELEPVLKRIDRSILRLTELGKVFRSYESVLSWSRDEVSISSLAVLRPLEPRRGADGAAPLPP